MMKPIKNVVTVMAMGVFLFGLTACEKQQTAEQGPAQQTGQKIDKAAARAGEELNKAAEKAGEGMQQLGQKLQNSAQDAQKKD